MDEAAVSARAISVEPRTGILDITVKTCIEDTGRVSKLVGFFISRLIKKSTKANGLQNASHVYNTCVSSDFGDSPGLNTDHSCSDSGFLHLQRALSPAGGQG